MGKVKEFRATQKSFHFRSEHKPATSAETNQPQYVTYVLYSRCTTRYTAPILPLYCCCTAIRNDRLLAGVYLTIRNQLTKLNSGLCAICPAYLPTSISTCTSYLSTLPIALPTPHNDILTLRTVCSRVRPRLPNNCTPHTADYSFVNTSNCARRRCSAFGF